MSSFEWPGAGGGSSANASVGPTGSVAPTSATEIGAIGPTGLLVPLQADGNDNLLVAFGTGATPIPVSQSGTWNITNITGTVSLPTGAATSALQSTGNTTLSTISTTLGSILLDLTNGTQVTSVNNFPATQPVSGTVAATQSGTWNITNISGTVTLPTLASTSTLQTAGNTSLATIATNTTGSSTSALQSSTQGAGTTPGTAATASTLVGAVYTTSPPTLTTGQQTGLRVDVNGELIISPLGSSSTVTVFYPGRITANPPVYNVYGSTNITTSAYVQLVASTSNSITYVDIFDSSGQAMILATGASGSEVIVGYIPPGGDQIQISIPASTRIAYKALTSNATAGYLLLNMYK